MTDGIKKKGRPEIYTPELAIEVCRRIAEGQSLRTIGKCPDMPNISTVYTWIHADKGGFSKQYEKAKSDQADAMAEDMMDISDNEDIDVARAKLMVDTRKWLASKFKAKKYGDSTQLRHADADGEKLDIESLLGEINGKCRGLPKGE